MKLLAELDRADPGTLQDCIGYSANGYYDQPVCVNCRAFVDDTGWHVDPETGDYTCQ